MPGSDCRQRSPPHPINRVAAFDRIAWPLSLGIGGRIDSDSATLTAINAEKAQSCALMKVTFYTGKTDAKVVTKDGVWQITHILITGIVSHRGIQPLDPRPRWIAIAVPSASA